LQAGARLTSLSHRCLWQFSDDVRRLAGRRNGVFELKRRAPAEADAATIKARLLNGTGADVRFGSWSCKNALAEALTPSDLGYVAGCGHFAEFGGFFRL
jgi:hypothetical protein